jgi:hypothetical protein
MAIQVRHLGSRLLLILALRAALLAGIIAARSVMRRRIVVHAVITSSQPQYVGPLGNGDGGAISAQDIQFRPTSVSPA